MKDYTLEGRVTFIDNHNGFKICGASTIDDDEIDDTYNSFSFSRNTLTDTTLKAMYGSAYKIDISSTKKDNFIEYLLVKIDSLNTGDGSIAFAFKSNYSENVTNTENRVIKLIIKPGNDLVRSFKYGNKYYFKLDVSDREDADL